MEDKVITRRAYSLMFLVLAIWSFIPYMLPSDTSLLVFNKVDIYLEMGFIFISFVACQGTLNGEKYGYIAGVFSILLTIIHLGYEQLIILDDSNLLQLATLLTMFIILVIYASVFQITYSPKRARLSTIELSLESGI